MSNIYEALEQAQREKSGSEVPHVISIPEEVHPKEQVLREGERSRSASASSMDTEMFCLYQNIEYQLPDTPEKTILFMGSQGGEGVSTIVRDFAKMPAARTSKWCKVVCARVPTTSPTKCLPLRPLWAAWVAMVRTVSLARPTATTAT